MIIIAYQGVGKSTLANRDNKFIDLESTMFYYGKRRPDNWYVFYCNIAIDLSKQGFNVFVSSHESVRNRLYKYSTEPLICVIPSVKLKKEWIDKLHNRWIEDKSEKNFKAWMGAVDYFDSQIPEIQASNIECIVIDDIDYDLEEILNNHNIR